MTDQNKDVEQLSRPRSQAEDDRSDVLSAFVEHWGMMARSWGINATMGELFALLFITGRDWTADELRHRLRVSRGNVSMNLRELMVWGVVIKVHRQGERREYFRAEGDVWTLFRHILAERKKRELDPTLALLQSAPRLISGSPAEDPVVIGRLADLARFFGLVDTLASRLLQMEPSELRELENFLAPSTPGSTGPTSTSTAPKN